jgi:hypothetical protein
MRGRRPASTNRDCCGCASSPGSPSRVYRLRQPVPSRVVLSRAAGRCVDPPLSSLASAGCFARPPLPMFFTSCRRMLCMSFALCCRRMLCMSFASPSLPAAGCFACHSLPAFASPSLPAAGCFVCPSLLLSFGVLPVTAFGPGAFGSMRRYARRAHGSLPTRRLAGVTYCRRARRMVDVPHCPLRVASNRIQFLLPPSLNASWLSGSAACARFFYQP